MLLNVFVLVGRVPVLQLLIWVVDYGGFARRVLIAISRAFWLPIIITVLDLRAIEVS